MTGSDQTSSDGDRPRASGLFLVPAEGARRTGSEAFLHGDADANARSDAARLRDEIAAQRDRDADTRDALADARDELAEAFDAEIDALERNQTRSGGARVGLQVLLRAAEDRKRAQVYRARAQSARRAGANERRLAREDRERAAEDRSAAAFELADAGIDSLTGALRRHVGIAAIAREVERARRTGEVLVVAFVDVDGLKVVNDTRGHEAGDRLLRAVVEAIQNGLRPYDLVVRYGGDEFICSLAGQGLPAVRERFDRICASISIANAGAGISVGLTEAGAGVEIDALIAQADQAMIGRRRTR